MATGMRQTLALLALVAFGFGAGCSSDPVSPDPVTAPSPQFLKVQNTGGVQPIPIGQEPDPSLYGEADIDGDVGGTLTVGRFTLVIPPGAYEGSAKICIEVPDTSVLISDLHVLPEAKNDFKVPVTLKVKCDDLVRNDQWDDLYILWHDTENGAWKPPAATTYNLSKGAVETRLDHFSEYGVVSGRSGW